MGVVDARIDHRDDHVLRPGGQVPSLRSVDVSVDGPGRFSGVIETPKLGESRIVRDCQRTLHVVGLRICHAGLLLVDGSGLPDRGPLVELHLDQARHHRAEALRLDCPRLLVSVALRSCSRTWLEADDDLARDVFGVCRYGGGANALRRLAGLARQHCRSVRWRLARTRASERDGSENDGAGQHNRERELQRRLREPVRSVPRSRHRCRLTVCRSCRCGPSASSATDELRQCTRRAAALTRSGLAGLTAGR